MVTHFSLTWVWDMCAWGMCQAGPPFYRPCPDSPAHTDELTAAAGRVWPSAPFCTLYRLPIIVPGLGSIPASNSGPLACPTPPWGGGNCEPPSPRPQPPTPPFLPFTICIVPLICLTSNVDIQIITDCLLAL